MKKVKKKQIVFVFVQSTLSIVQHIYESFRFRSLRVIITECKTARRARRRSHYRRNECIILTLTFITLFWSSTLCLIFF